MDRDKIIRILGRTAAVMASAILVNATLLANLDTYSWFTNKVQSSISVKAASTTDILSEITVIDSCGNLYDYTDGTNKNTVHNPEFIQVRGKNEVSKKIYFELGDDIQNFILHISPVAAKSNMTATAAINVSINPWEYNKILSYNRDSADDEHKYEKFKEPWLLKGQIVYGAIYVKYLNDYVSVRIPVSFDLWYLLCKEQETINYISDREAKVAELEAKVAALTANEDRLMTAIRSLEGEKGAKDQEIKRLMADIAAYSEQLESLRNSIDSAPAEGTTGNTAPAVPENPGIPEAPTTEVPTPSLPELPVDPDPEVKLPDPITIPVVPAQPTEPLATEPIPNPETKNQ